LVLKVIVLSPDDAKLHRGAGDKTTDGT
jgi:hypothetical protein